MTLNPESPEETRAGMRRGELAGSTHGLAPGYVQVDLAILPRKPGSEFLLFCQRNPESCIVRDVTEVGDPGPKLMAPGADLRELPLLDSPAPGHMFVAGVLNEELSSR